MPPELPPWPASPPTFGPVLLRRFTDQDSHLAIELGTDPYLPLIGSLPAFPTEEQAVDWIDRQRGRFDDGTVEPCVDPRRRASRV